MKKVSVFFGNAGVIVIGLSIITLIIQIAMTAFALVVYGDAQALNGLLGQNIAARFSGLELLELLSGGFSLTISAFTFTLQKEEKKILQ